MEMLKSVSASLIDRVPLTVNTIAFLLRSQQILNGALKTYNRLEQHIMV